MAHVSSTKDSPHAQGESKRRLTSPERQSLQERGRRSCKQAAAPCRLPGPAPRPSLLSTGSSTTNSSENKDRFKQM